MKLIPKLAGILALGLACGAAHADTFTFTYLFGDGLEVTGSLDGNESADGLYVENVTNVSVFFGTDAMTGPIQAFQFDPLLGYLAGAVVSFNGSLNNFAFADYDMASGLDYNSIFTIWESVDLGHTALAHSPLLGYGSQDLPTVEASWSLTRVAAPPVPDQGATLALLAASLGLLGWTSNRLRAARAV